MSFAIRKLASSDAELAASTATQVRIRDDMKQAVTMINNLEIMRKKAEDERTAASASGDVASRLSALEGKLFDTELQLISRANLEGDDKYYVEPYKVYMNLVWLYGEIGNGAGDEAGGADYAPTTQSLEVLAQIEKDLAAARVAYDAVLSNDVAAFNKAAEGHVAPITPELTQARR